MANLTLTAIAGPYTVTWGTPALNVGVTEDGVETEETYFSDPVRGDNLGDTIQDEIIRGGDVYVNFILQEYLNALTALGNGAGIGPIFHPHNTVLGRVGQVGRRLSSIAAPLVLTAVAGTPASAAPATITFALATLARNFPVRLLYASRHRKVPMRMISLPCTDSPGETADQARHYLTT